MKKNTKIYLWIAIIITIIVIGIISIFLIKNNSYISEETIKCIAEKSEFYVLSECPACKEQKKLFGENYYYLNITDCTFETEKCINTGIKRIPTWIISGKKYEGVQSIRELKELTGC